METVEDPVLGTCTVIRQRAGTDIWPLSFIAMGIAGPCILATWFFGHARFDGQIILMGLIATFMTPAIPANLKSLNRPYFAMVGPNGFKTPGSGPIMWSEVADFGLSFYRGKPVRLNLKLSRSLPVSFSTRLASYFGLLQRDAAHTMSFGLKGSTLPDDELFELFTDHITGAQNANASSPPVEAE